MTDTAVRRDDHLGLLVAGYVMAFVLPIGGFVAGIALAGHRTGHALAIVTISFFTACGWVLLILVPVLLVHHAAR